MSLDRGTKLGPYEVLEPIGAGGMGEVYKARDTRLDRIVAIKVLPPHIASRPEARERFEREARTVSSLNHPHICSLFDVGQQDGIGFLVMEYLEGETLADRLKKGALPTKQILDYARQIADALDAAHRKNVVHRDLKPGNIMLTKSGAKLLDFGLAKVRATSVGDETLTQALTSEGTLLGTLQYMAPEQLEGKEVDPRTDIFAFGEVLYEMATGRKAFIGTSQASLIANIMHVDPPAGSTLRPATPLSLDRVIQRCLAKDPDQRWQNVRDAIIGLDWEIAQPANRRTLSYRAWMIAVLALAAMLILLVLYFWRPPAEMTVTQFAVAAPEKTTFGRRPSVALSPDGHQLAFVAIDGNGKSLLWVRPLNSLNARALPGTEEAASPFWSPDGRHLGFFAQNKLKRVDVTGGTVQALCDAPPYSSGAWSRDGVILFAASMDGLRRIPAAGGAPASVTKLDKSRDERTHSWPHFLPDSRHFLYRVTTNDVGQSWIGAGSLDSPETKRLLSVNSNAIYVPPQTSGPGYLLYGQGATLLAQPFDADHLRTTGDQIPVAENVRLDTAVGRFPFSASENGVLAYESGNWMTRQLTWLDRDSNKAEPVGATSLCYAHQLSPDGKRILMEIRDAATGTGRVWVFDLLRGSLSLLSSSPTPSPNWDFTPTWSPDGNSIAFVRFTSSSRTVEIYQKMANGAGNEELLVKLPVKRAAFVDEWSSDGRFLLFEEPKEPEGWDLMTLPVSGERRPVPYLTGNISRRWGQFSPDGRWIAYVSSESGSDEVYVQSFPVPTAKWAVSVGGGTYPRWRRDGKELFYLSPAGKLMAVAVKGGATFEAGAPNALMDIGELGRGFTRNPYDVTADGRRFLVNRAAGASAATPITVVLNWTNVLRK